MNIMSKFLQVTMLTLFLFLSAMSCTKNQGDYQRYPNTWDRHHDPFYSDRYYYDRPVIVTPNEQEVQEVEREIDSVGPDLDPGGSADIDVDMGDF